MATKPRWYYVRKQRRMLNDSQGFDYVNNLHSHVLWETICKEDGRSPLVDLYARMGLHRYNMLQGTNLQLSSVKKYNTSKGSAAASYYITLEAMDPDSELLQTFQTRVCENNFGHLILSCPVARPLGETKRSDIGEEIKRSSDRKPFFLSSTMPEWPPENPFDSKRSYVLSKSEVQENDWIRLYLELAVATQNQNRFSLEKHDLSKLEILEVAIDTTSKDVAPEELNRKNVATVYIRYRDSCEARVGKDVDRVAVVRRAFNDRLDHFSLVGQTLSSETAQGIEIKGKVHGLSYTKKG